MMVLLLLGDTRYRGDAFHYPPFTAEKTRHGGETTGDTRLLGLAPLEAGPEILLVVCKCLGVSLPNVRLDEPPGSACAWFEYLWKSLPEEECRQLHAARGQ